LNKIDSNFIKSILFQKMMSIPIEHIRNMAKWTECGEYFTIAKFKSKEICFNARLLRTNIFILDICYDQYKYECGRRYNVIKFFGDSKKNQEEQITCLFASFFEWKHKLASDQYHMLNDKLITNEMYQTLLFTNSLINEEENDVCYICHEPCLFYETIGDCEHRIHRFCALQMFQKNGLKTLCGICKTPILRPICPHHMETDDEDEYDE
jgi:hypothetical protein